MACTKTTAAQLALRNPANGLATLTVEYFDQHKKFKRIGTGVKVVPSKWDAANLTIKANGSPDPASDTKTVRAKLAHVNSIISDLDRQLKRMPTVSELTEALAAAAAPVADNTLLLPALAEWLAVPRKWAPATVKSFKTLYNNLAAYQTHTKTVLKFDAFTNASVNEFQHWLMDTYNPKNSVLAKRVSQLKQFLNEVGEKHSLKVNTSRIKALYSVEKHPPFVLSAADIEALRTVKTPTKKLERVQDLFTLQVFTGLRESDVSRINHTHVDYKKGTLTIRQQKVKANVTIPLFPHAAAVLKKYTNGKGEIELPELSQQKYNDYLKELAQLLPEMDEMVYSYEHRGDKTEQVCKQKSSSMHSHVCRYSFVTLCLSLGYKESEVRQWSGHKTLTAFQRYIGVTEINKTVAQRFAAAYENAVELSK